MTDTQERVEDQASEYDEYKVARAQARTDRINTVNTEWRALQEWKRNGKVDEQPATPTLDQLQGEAFKPIRLSVDTVKSNGHKSSGRKSVEPTPGHRFFRNDRPFSDSDNTLSSLAYQCTKGIDGDRKRISTTELEVLLTAAGIESPRTSVWEHTLANGVRLAARIVDGEEPVATQPKPSKKAAAAVEVLDRISEPLSAPKPKSRAKSAPPVPELIKLPVAPNAREKKAFTGKAPKQPRKGNKPVAGIKPPARRRAS